MQTLFLLVSLTFFSFSRMWRRSSVIQTDIEEEADLVNRLTSSDGTFPVWELLCFGFFFLAEVFSLINNVAEV